MSRTDGLRTSQRPPGRIALRWLAVLEGLEERIKGRVLRGRTLARAGRVAEIEIAPGMALAEVGDAEPQRPTIRVRTFDESEWASVITALRADLGVLAKLLEGQLADELFTELDARGVPLVPRVDELDGDCDCGDWAVPCAHGAALHHVLSEALDGEPFLLFTLRGRTGEQLLAELRRGWGDTGSTRGPPPERVETPGPEIDPFRSPVEPEVLTFRFAANTGPAGLFELGPLPGDDDLPRALQPLYEAGAAAALAIALSDLAGDGPRRRRGRSAVPLSQPMRTLPPPPPLTRARAAPPAPEPEPEATAPATETPALSRRAKKAEASATDLTERIVDALADFEEGALAADLGKKLDVPAARVQRELTELESLGLVYRSGRGASGRWFLG